MNNEHFELARTRNCAECGSDEEMMWLALHPSVNQELVNFTVHCTVLSALYTVHCTVLSTLHTVLYYPHCTQYFTIHTVHCTVLSTLYYTIHTVHCTVLSTLYTVLYYPQYTQTFILPSKSAPLSTSNQV